MLKCQKKIEHLIILQYTNSVSISFPEKRLYYDELSKQFLQYIMHNERERPYKRKLESFWDCVSDWRLFNAISVKNRLYCLQESLSLVIKAKQRTGHTFVHPYTRGDNNTMGTSIKQSVGQISVLVENMRQKGVELCKFDFSQMVFCGHHRPVEVPHTGFPPPPNDFTSFFFAQLCQYFLNF